MMFNFLHRHERNRRSANLQSVAVQSPAARSNRVVGTEAPPSRFDPIKWAQANPWLVEGQADDRLPVSGAVPASDGSPAEQRSLARRTHQLMFKKWSQARHD